MVDVFFLFFSFYLNSRGKHFVQTASTISYSKGQMLQNLRVEETLETSPCSQSEFILPPQHTTEVQSP
jgi:hypothetical protein